MAFSMWAFWAVAQGVIKKGLEPDYYISAVLNVAEEAVQQQSCELLFKR